MRVLLLAVVVAGLSSCNPQNPYISRNDPSRNPSGTPADRTGGARNVPVWVGRFPNAKAPEPHPGTASPVNPQAVHPPANPGR